MQGCTEGLAHSAGNFRRVSHLGWWLGSLNGSKLPLQKVENALGANQYLVGEAEEGEPDDG